MVKLRVENKDDIVVISSLLQDAILRVGEIKYSKTKHSLTLRFTRFRHETEKSERILCGLRLDGVGAVTSRGIEKDNKDALAVLLSMTFEPSSNVALAPSGKVHLFFAGNGEILCDVECLDITLADIAEARETKSQPLHPLED